MLDYDPESRLTIKQALQEFSEISNFLLLDKSSNKKLIILI